MSSGTSPGAADLDIDGGVVTTECHVQSHVDAVLASKFVTETRAAGQDCLGIVEAFEIIPSGASAGESYEAEPFPELPAEFGLELRDLFPLVAHDGRAAQGYERAHVKGRVAKAGCRIASKAEEKAAA